VRRRSRKNRNRKRLHEGSPFERFENQFIPKNRATESTRRRPDFVSRELPSPGRFCYASIGADSGAAAAWAAVCTGCGSEGTV
jgi:hypothetical protein